MALGLADPSLLQPQDPAVLELDAGWQLYLKKIGKSLSLGGLAKSSQKRYRAVFEKFIPFAQKRQLRTWNHITRTLVDDYLTWLDDEGYSHGSVYFEVTCIKQMIKWLIGRRKSQSPVVSYILFPSQMPLIDTVGLKKKWRRWSSFVRIVVIWSG